VGAFFCFLKAQSPPIQLRKISPGDIVGGLRRTDPFLGGPVNKY